MATDLLTQVRIEIEGRLAELRPAVAEYQRLLGASDALGASGEPAGTYGEPAGAANGSGPTQRARRVIRASGAKADAASAAKAAAPKRRQSRMGPVEQAILAALEHGSHTVGELGVVTALPASALRDGARKLLGAGKIARASREGKAAYALSGSA